MAGVGNGRNSRVRYFQLGTVFIIHRYFGPDCLTRAAVLELHHPEDAKAPSLQIETVPILRRMEESIKQS